MRDFDRKKSPLAFVVAFLSVGLSTSFVGPTARPTGSRCSNVHSSLSLRATNNFEYALLFDCDGVILETEELHRLAYNAAFEQAGLTIVDPETKETKPVEWSVEYYDVLQNTIGGGKPKMWHYFTNTVQQFPSQGTSGPPPTTQESQQALIDKLQDNKTELYKEMIQNKAVPRPGVLDLMDAALADPSIAVGVCSASTKEAAQKVLQVTLGDDRVNRLDVCILGDDVSEKKPSPMIYNVARERLGIDDPKRCVVVEDSMAGLRAAVDAGMRCIITYTESTKDEDFYGVGADAKVPDLRSHQVTLDSIFGSLRGQGLDAPLLDGIKDPTKAISSSR